MEDLFVTHVGQTDIKIEWTYCDGEKSGEHSITVDVLEYDACPPHIVETYPEDGTVDIDPLELQDVDIKIVFTEPITAKTGNIYIQIGEGEKAEKIQWDVVWSEDKTILTLKYKEGVDIPYDAKITVVIEHAEDMAGIPNDLEFSFTTKAKE